MPRLSQNSERGAIALVDGVIAVAVVLAAIIALAVFTGTTARQRAGAQSTPELDAAVNSTIDMRAITEYSACPQTNSVCVGNAAQAARNVAFSDPAPRTTPTPFAGAVSKGIAMPPIPEANASVTLSGLSFSTTTRVITGSVQTAKTTTQLSIGQGTAGAADCPASLQTAGAC